MVKRIEIKINFYLFDTFNLGDYKHYVGGTRSAQGGLFNILVPVIYTYLILVYFCVDRTYYYNS